MDINGNAILKKMLKKMNFGVYKEYNRSMKTKLCKFLEIDFQNVEPIIFNGRKYVKSEHEKNTFIFLDDNFLVIGILIGNEHCEKLSFFEKYDTNNYCNKIRYIKAKNRKNLTEKAKYILMITPEMRFVHERAYKPLEKLNKKNYLINLEMRLNKYKSEKMKNIDHEGIKKIIKEILIEFSKQDFFNGNEIWNKIGRLSSICNDYEFHYKEYLRLCKLKQYDSSDDLTNYTKNLYKTRIEKNRIEIYDFYKKMLKK